MLDFNNKFDYFEEALNKGAWTPDGRFCILGIKEVPYSGDVIKKEVLVYKEQTGTLMWQYIYETKNKVFINKRGENINLALLVKRSVIETMREVSQNAKELI